MSTHPRTALDAPHDATPRHTSPHVHPPPQVIPTAELAGAAEASVARWEAVANHPNMVGLREAFVSSDWDGGSPSLFFVHDYHPGAADGAVVTVGGELEVCVLCLIGEEGREHEWGRQARGGLWCGTCQ